MLDNILIGILLATMVISFAVALYSAIYTYETNKAFALHCYEKDLLPIDTPVGLRCADIGALQK